MLLNSPCSGANPRGREQGKKGKESLFQSYTMFKHNSTLRQTCPRLHRNLLLTIPSFGEHRRLQKGPPCGPLRERKAKPQEAPVEGRARLASFWLYIPAGREQEGPSSSISSIHYTCAASFGGGAWAGGDPSGVLLTFLPPRPLSSSATSVLNQLKRDFQMDVKTRSNPSVSTGDPL